MSSQLPEETGRVLGPAEFQFEASNATAVNLIMAAW
jgi:hypothetical protein